MVGVQKIELTESSVSEALQDYLNKHLVEGAKVKVTAWKGGDRYGATIDVTFENAKVEPGILSPPPRRMDER